MLWFIYGGAPVDLPGCFVSLSKISGCLWVSLGDSWDALIHLWECFSGSPRVLCESFGIFVFSNFSVLYILQDPPRCAGRYIYIEVLLNTPRENNKQSRDSRKTRRSVYHSL